jgi:hypothetical protein
MKDLEMPGGLSEPQDQQSSLLTDLQIHDILHQAAVIALDERLKCFDPRLK